MPESRVLRNQVQFIAALLAACALPSVLNAAEPKAFEEIVVTSSRVPLPQKRIATSVSVLTADDIAAHGNTSLAAVLNYLPGTNASSNGGAGQITSLRIRGEEGYRTLTLLDGIRLSDPASTQVGPQIEHLLSSGAGRIELLRGPQGLAYGADAGGVLSISSPASRDGMHLGMDVQSGAYDTQQYSATLAGARAGKDIYLNVTDFSTTGFNSQSSDSVLQDADGYDNQSIHARARLQLSDQLQLELVHRRSEAATAYDYCFSLALTHDCASDYDLRASRVALSYQGEQQTQVLSYASTGTDRNYFADRQESFSAKGELERLEYQGTLLSLPLVDLVYGADLEQALNEGSGRYNRGYYAEALSDFSDELFLAAGVRHDSNDDFGSNNSYRVSAAWLQQLSAVSVLKLRGSVGTGFRAPSPYEVAYNQGPWSYPPASLTRLQQEKSKGWELGAEWYWQDDLELALVYFDQQIENAIDFDLTGFSGYLQDPGNSTSNGIEFSMKQTLTDTLQLNFNYTNNQTERPNGLPRRYRAEHLASAGLAWNPATPLLLDVFVRYASKPFDESLAVSSQLAAFTVLDLSASYQLNQQMQLYGRVENALDRQYQEIAGYNTAGRSAYIGFRFSFDAN